MFCCGTRILVEIHGDLNSMFTAKGDSSGKIDAIGSEWKAEDGIVFVVTITQ